MNDSEQETRAHIARVGELLDLVRDRLRARGIVHDESKLGPVEKPIFDRVAGKLKGLTYGSDEYKSSLKELGPALEHHYANNSHHPEHYQKQVCIICFAEYSANFVGYCDRCANGTFTKEPNIAGMSLLDLIEMLCDWKAAGERHADGSMARSLEVNRDRFKIEPQLQSILENTARELGWKP